jgi:hypothetical protein
MNKNLAYLIPKCLGSSVSIVSDYGLDDRVTGVGYPTEAKDFSSSLCVQTGPGAHPASYPMGTGGPFPGGNFAYFLYIISKRFSTTGGLDFVTYLLGAKFSSHSSKWVKCVRTVFPDSLRVWKGDWLYVLTRILATACLTNG